MNLEKLILDLSKNMFLDDILSRGYFILLKA